MPHPRHWLDRAVTLASDAAGLAAGGCILVTALIVFYEIVMRAFFDAPTEWSIETSVYLVLIAGFLGLAITYADEKHIRVDILTSRLSPRRQLQLRLLTEAAVLVFASVLLIESWDMAITSYTLQKTSTSTLRVPLFLPELSLSLGSLLLVLQVARRLLLDLASLRGSGGHQVPPRGEGRP